METNQGGTSGRSYCDRAVNVLALVIEQLWISRWSNGQICYNAYIAFQSMTQWIHAWRHLVCVYERCGLEFGGQPGDNTRTIVKVVVIPMQCVCLQELSGWWAV